MFADSPDTCERTIKYEGVPRQRTESQCSRAAEVAGDRLTQTCNNGRRERQGRGHEGTGQKQKRKEAKENEAKEKEAKEERGQKAEAKEERGRSSFEDWFM